MQKVQLHICKPHVAVEGVVDSLGKVSSTAAVDVGLLLVLSLV